LTSTLARNGRVLICTSLVTLIVIVGLIGSALAPHDPLRVDMQEAYQAPSIEHWFGTDDLGRDVLSRVLSGARTSLSVAFMAVVIGFGVGTCLGLVAGYAGGLLDVISVLIIDALTAFPSLLLAIAITTMLGPQIQHAMIAIGIVSIPTFARLTRGQVLSLRQREWAVAARVIGASPARVMLVHILPSALNTLIVHASLSAASAILAEATLAYLGLGAQPPSPSWGQDINYSQRHLTNRMWWMTAGPGLAVVITVLTFNVFGDAIRDAIDPRQRRSPATDRLGNELTSINSFPERRTVTTT